MSKLIDTGLLFAFFSTLLLGSNKLAVRKTVFTMDESLATMFSIVLAIPIFGIPLIFLGFGAQAIPLNAILIFAATGIVNYSVGRWMVWKSIGAIGANRGNILAASQSVYAIAIAVVFLHQRIDLYIGGGITLVLLGILIISRRNSTDRRAFTKAQLRTGLIYGVMGAFFWGLAQVLMQVGIKQYSNPTGATFLTYSFSLIGMVPMLFFTSRSAVRHGRTPFKIDRKSLAFVGIVTLMGSFAQFFRYISLVTVPVTIVATINGSNPMITLVLSYALIRQIEFIDRKTILGIISSVAGVILVTL